MFENFCPLIISGIDLSDLILKLLFLDTRTLIKGSLKASTGRFCKRQKDMSPMKQNLLEIFIVFESTLFEKQILYLPKFD